MTARSCFCVADQNPSFQPAARLVESITSASPALVTTTFAHQYNTGLIVRFRIPEICGMYQLDKQTFQITVVDATSFTIPVDATSFEAFVVVVPEDVPDYIDICCWVIPIGEGTDYTNSALINVSV